MKSSVLSKIGLLPLVAGASVVILISSALVGHYASLGYRALFLEFQQSSMQHQLRGEVQARMWEGTTQPLNDAAGLLAQSSDLRLLGLRRSRDPNGVRPSDYAETLTKAVADETGTLAMDVRERIRGALLLDHDFRLLATTGTITPPSAETLAQWSQYSTENLPSENRRVAWVVENNIFAGLMRRPTGRGNQWTIVIATNALPVFDSVESRAGAGLEILSIDQSKTIRPSQVKLPDGAEATVAMLTLFGPDEAPLALVRATYDIAELSSGLARVRDIAFAIFLVVSGGLSAIYLVAIAVHLRRQKRVDAEVAARETERMEEIRRRGEEAEAARIKAEQARQNTVEVAEVVSVTIDEALQPVSDSAETLRQDAEKLNTSAAEAAAKTDTATSACRELSDLITSVAAGCEELGYSAKDVSSQLVKASELAAEAAGGANTANRTMLQLSHASKGINDIARTISDIANQTNLLALNATIESARAGEAGKGFSVVASEVKALANQTVKASQEISRQIDDLQQEMNEAVKEVTNALNAIQGVDKRIADVSQAMAQQATATAEIGASISQASGTTESVVGVVVELNASARQTRDLASTTKRAVSSIDSSVVHLKDRARQELVRLSS
jgi:methyl-accepting chemotaxis protein